MSPPAAVPAADGGGGGGGQQPRQQQQGGFGQSIAGIIRIAVFWYFASKFFSPKKSADPSHLISNLFQKGEPLDMWLYLSEHQMFNDFGNEASLVWHETNIPYATWGPESTRTLSLNYYPSDALKNNGSLYAHVFFARYQPQASFGRTHSVVAYLPKSRSDKRKSLLGNSKDAEGWRMMLKLNLKMMALSNGLLIGNQILQLTWLKILHDMGIMLCHQI